VISPIARGVCSMSHVASLRSYRSTRLPRQLHVVVACAVQPADFTWLWDRAGTAKIAFVDGLLPTGIAMVRGSGRRVCACVGGEGGGRELQWPRAHMLRHFPLPLPRLPTHFHRRAMPSTTWTPGSCFGGKVSAPSSATA